MEPDAVEIRVLGCLIEKQRTTPDSYPLSLNSLRLACNQSTNREPVVEYDEATIRKALGELGRRRWIRSASGHTSRSAKYRHLLKDELGLPPNQMSVLGVLMLRGAQTPGELKQRADRLHHFDSLADLHEALEALIERGLARQLPRRPGQKEERYEQRLGRSVDDEDVASGPAEGAPLIGSDRTPDATQPSSEDERLAKLERELAELRREVAALREALEDRA